ncbi:MAG: ATP-binding cassette domain-containing protein, partial [Oscillospiraceae bacterium]
MIEISNLTKVFKTAGEEQTVLNNISLNIEKGDIFGIIGVSGAGKSTLLRCIGMMEKPTTGKIVIDGVDITNIKGNEIIETRKKFGVIAQGYNLLMQRTVLKNVTFPLELRHIDKEQRVEKAMEM